MAIYTVLLSMVVCVAGFNRDNLFTSSPHIADLFQTLCPGTNDCSINQTSKEPSAIRNDSCCTGCSCRPSCKDNGNCCFQNRTQRFGEQPFRTRHSCLFPSSIQPPVQERFQFHSYIMISEVHVPTTSDDSSSIECGDRNIAPWGSLYPVYSAKRKQIYKNSACAEADGVDDGKLWDAKIVCRQPRDAYTSDVSRFVQGLESNSLSNICKVDFIYKEKLEDIQMQRCYLDIVDTCHASDFDIPDGVSISKTEIIAACNSGLWSPFSGKTMYANVFCRICNGDSFGISEECTSDTDGSGSFSRNQGFVALLDSDFIKMIQNNNKRMAIFPEACCRHNTTCFSTIGCRRLFCPSGQLHDESGQCRHPNKIWYKNLYEINIELTVEGKLNVNELFQDTGFSTTFPDLQTPWGDKWTVFSVYHEHVSENVNTTRLQVTIINNLSKMYPDQFFKYVQQTVNRDWLLKHNNVTIPLNASFSIYVTLNSDSIIDFGNDSKTVSTPLFSRVYLSFVNIHGSKQVVTKLYLCDQIELTENDFILSQNKEMLFNKITSKIMFDAEFALIYGQNFDGLLARICLSDSGFYRTNKAAVSFESTTCKLCCTLPLFVLLYVGDG